MEKLHLCVDFIVELINYRRHRREVDTSFTYKIEKWKQHSYIVGSRQSMKSQLTALHHNFFATNNTSARVV